MPNLTQTEAWFLDECLKGEKMLFRKLASSASQVSDPQLRQLCQDIQKVHQRHVDILAGQIM
ncbi:MAG TPA: spore coat protein [Clostridia bacterium]|nr:spore coat protein [Clostridia bacterium]